MKHTILSGLLGTLALLSSQPAVGQDAPGVPASTQPAAITRPGVVFTPVAHVEKRGTGSIAMVLIPGLSCDWTVFETFMDRNAAKYTMYAVTLPGFGGSEPPAAEKQVEGGQVRMGAWLDNASTAVWKVVQEKKIEKPVIVGHSLGGHLALRIGAEHAGDVRAVVAIDGAPAFPFGDTPAQMTREDRLQMAEMMAEQFQGITPEQMEQNQRMMVKSMVTDEARGEELADLCVKVPSATTIHYMADLVAADIRDQLPKLTVPVLVTPSVPSREKDMVDRVARIWTELMEGAPKATIAVFEDTRHFIQDDRPVELDAAIGDFLAGKVVKGFKASVPATSPATKPG